MDLHGPGTHKACCSPRQLCDLLAHYRLMGGGGVVSLLSGCCVLSLKMLCVCIVCVFNDYLNLSLSQCVEAKKYCWYFEGGYPIYFM